MSFSLRFPELPPRSHDAPSFRRYALRGRRIGWVLDSQKTDCRPKFDRWTALAIALGVTALILALWPSAKAETHAPKICWVHVMLG